MCSNCTVTYYGKICRLLFIRATERMGISNLTERSVKTVRAQISNHLLQYDCSTDFDHFCTLASDTQKIRLHVKESLFIKREKPVLNRTIGSFPLKLSD